MELLVFFNTGGGSGGITAPGKFDSGVTITAHSTLSESLYILYFSTLLIYHTANGNKNCICTCYIVVQVYINGHLCQKVSIAAYLLLEILCY